MKRFRRANNEGKLWKETESYGRYCGYAYIIIYTYFQQCTNCHLKAVHKIIKYNFVNNSK